MNKTHITPLDSANFIKSKLASSKPKIAIILGSGLTGFSEELTNSITIPYNQIPGFPKLSVHGHTAELSIGYIGKTSIICLKGRIHYYEGNNSDSIKHYIRTLKDLGCEILLATNASGSLNQNVPPGSLVLVKDHINFQSTNPLIGPNDEAYGPRFFPIDNLYNKAIRHQLQSIATQTGIELFEGVYLATMGPNYETEAEIRAFKVLGARI